MRERKDKAHSSLANSLAKKAAAKEEQYLYSPGTLLRPRWDTVNNKPLTVFYSYNFSVPITDLDILNNEEAQTYFLVGPKSGKLTHQISNPLFYLGSKPVTYSGSFWVHFFLVTNKESDQPVTVYWTTTSPYLKLLVPA